MAFTPVKGKRALPLSTSLFFLEQPSHQSDLQVALDHVKFQYWKGHWTECIAKCQQLLSDPQVLVGKGFAPLKSNTCDRLDSRRLYTLRTCTSTMQYAWIALDEACTIPRGEGFKSSSYH